MRQARDAALASKRVQGILVGDRFVLLASPAGRRENGPTTAPHD